MLVLSPEEGGRGSTTLSVLPMAGKEVSSVVAAAGAKRAEETCNSPPGPLGGPREVSGVAQRPGTVRQERGGGVVVVVSVGVGVREGVGVAVPVKVGVGVREGVQVGERVGVGLAVPQPLALPTPWAKPVLKGQGRGRVELSGQKKPVGQIVHEKEPLAAE